MLGFEASCLPWCGKPLFIRIDTSNGHLFKEHEAQLRCLMLLVILASAFHTLALKICARIREGTPLLELLPRKSKGMSDVKLPLERQRTGVGAGEGAWCAITSSAPDPEMSSGDVQRKKRPLDEAAK